MHTFKVGDRVRLRPHYKVEDLGCVVALGLRREVGTLICIQWDNEQMCPLWYQDRQLQLVKAPQRMHIEGNELILEET